MRFTLALITSTLLSQAVYAASDSESYSSAISYESAYWIEEASSSAVSSVNDNPSFERHNLNDFLKKLIFADDHVSNSFSSKEKEASSISPKVVASSLSNEDSYSVATSHPIMRSRSRSRERAASKLKFKHALRRYHRHLFIPEKKAHDTHPTLNKRVHDEEDLVIKGKNEHRTHNSDNDRENEESTIASEDGSSSRLVFVPMVEEESSDSINNNDDFITSPFNDLDSSASFESSNLSDESDMSLYSTNLLDDITYLDSSSSSSSSSISLDESSVLLYDVSILNDDNDDDDEDDEDDEDDDDSRSSIANGSNGNEELFQNRKQVKEKPQVFIDKDGFWIPDIHAEEMFKGYNWDKK